VIAHPEGDAGFRASAGPNTNADGEGTPGISLIGDRLVVDLGFPQRCLSSAVLGGGLGWVRTWINAQVRHGYSRTDPRRHLQEIARDLAAGEPVVGMLTAACVDRYQIAGSGSAWAVATVGGLLTHGLAAGAAPMEEPGTSVPRVSTDLVGTINILALVDRPLTDEALAGALITVVEAKARALATARIPAIGAEGYATGTPTDSVCVACPPGENVCFAGPATPVGNDLGRAVYEAVLAGALDEVARSASAGDVR